MIAPPLVRSALVVGVVALTLSACGGGASVPGGMGASGIGAARGDWTGPRPDDAEAREALRVLRERAIAMRSWPETSAFESFTRAESHAHFEAVARAAETLGVHSLRSIAARGAEPRRSFGPSPTTSASGCASSSPRCTSCS